MNFLIILVAKYFFIVVILLALAAFFMTDKTQRKNILKLSFLSLPFSLIIAKILRLFIYDPRPFAVEHIQPLISHIADNGFPSDHTLLTATIAVILFQFNKKLGLILFLLSFLIGLARILAKVHHLTDILGSLGIAIFATYLAWSVPLRFPKLSVLLENLASLVVRF